MTAPIGEASFRYLVVDDVEVNRAVLQRQILLASEEVECPSVCDCASSGPEAIELCSQHEYDLVIMDYNMPEMTGGEAARRIMALSPRSHIIGCTETVVLEEIADCLLSGMVEVLPKDPRKVRQIVKNNMYEPGRNFTHRKRSIH